jgi:hypothetical protein
MWTSAAVDEKIKRRFRTALAMTTVSGDRAWRESRALNAPNLSGHFLNEIQLAPLVIFGDQVAHDVR